MTPSAFLNRFLYQTHRPFSELGRVSTLSWDAGLGHGHHPPKEWSLQPTQGSSFRLSAHDFEFEIKLKLYGAGRLTELRER
jgi:hypothetical protein